MIDLSVNASTYSADWEYYQCPFCNEWHNIDDYYDCDVVIEYCSNCNQPVDDCDCCYYCGQSRVNVVIDVGSIRVYVISYVQTVDYIHASVAVFVIVILVLVKIRKQIVRVLNVLYVQGL